MAEQVVLIDDEDKRGGAERLIVERGGQAREIDLVPEKFDALWKLCVEYGRPVTKAKPKSPRGSEGPLQPALKEYRRPATQSSIVRAWAWEQGLDLVKKEGRVASEVTHAYEQFREGNYYYLHTLQANPAYTSKPVHKPDWAGQRELTDPATS